MQFEWDKNKERSNLLKHGLDFDPVNMLFSSNMHVYEDTRKDYGEKRYIGLGLYLTRCLCIIYTKRGDAFRIISLRKASERETKEYYKKLREN